MLDLAGCFLTEMADERAETGSLSDATLFAIGPTNMTPCKFTLKHDC